jgi:FkbM family methyltransferase
MSNLLAVDSVEWHTFHPRFVSSKSNILDLGANYGRFSKQMAERFGCKCYAVEPSPQVFSELIRTNLIQKFQVAICGKTGPVELHVDNSDLASSLLQGPNSKQVDAVTVRGVRLEEFVRELGLNEISLLKMDIEGAEIEVLDSCSDSFLRAIPQLTIEFHDFCGVVPHLEVERVVNRLKALGFFYVRMSRIGNQDTVFINTRLCRISALERLYIKYLSRNWKGFCRVVRRLVTRAQN